MRYFAILEQKDGSCECVVRENLEEVQKAIDNSSGLVCHNLPDSNEKRVYSLGQIENAYWDQSVPYRICKECFANWGRENNLRNIEIPPLREGTKIRPL